MRPYFRIRIGTKLALFLFFAGLFPMVLFGVLYVRNEQAISEKEIFNALVLLAESKEVRILEYFNNITARTVDFSSDGYIRDETKRLLSTGSPESKEALNRHLSVNKKPIDERIVGISILNKDGVVVASTDEKEIGKNESNDVYFKEGMTQASLVRTDPWDVHFNIVSPFVVAAPITDKDTHEFLGIIVNVFDPHKLEGVLAANFITNENASLEAIIGNNIKTLHAYIVDHEKNVILHPVKKEVDETHDIQLHTFPVEECLENGREVLGEYADHSGATVFGASMCLLERGLVLIVDIEKKEALLPAQRAQMQFLGIIGALAVFIALLAYVIANVLTKPIKTLQKSAEVVRGGNLHHRGFVAKTGDEIEDLGHAFNAMTASLEDRQRATEGEKKRLAALIEYLPVGVLMMKAPNGEVIAANSKSFELFDKEKGAWDEATQLHRSVYAVINPIKENGTPYPEEEFPITSALHKGKTGEQKNIVIKRRDGSKMTLHVIAVPIKEDGNTPYVVAVFDDITEEYEVDRAKTEFVSLASHQLRTPLSTINWYTEMLLAEDVGKVTPDQKSYLEEIYKGNQRMVGLVNALLNVSRIEMGTFAAEVRQIDLVAEANLVLDEFAVMAAQKNIAIVKEFSGTAFFTDADRKMIQIIFQNLISNAVKYTPEGGKVTARMRRESDDRVYIEVSDTGYGIPKNQYDKIFTKLFRADNIVYKDTEGTGLGLYLVKLVVDQLGGKIWFTSEENKGTSFFIILPAHNNTKNHERK